MSFARRQSRSTRTSSASTSTPSVPSGHGHHGVTASSNVTSQSPSIPIAIGNSSNGNGNNSDAFVFDNGSQWYAFRDHDNNNDDTNENEAPLSDKEHKDDSEGEGEGNDVTDTGTAPGTGDAMPVIWQCRGNSDNAWWSYSNSNSALISSAISSSSLPITINVTLLDGTSSDYIIRYTSWGTLQQYSPIYHSTRDIRSIPLPLPSPLLPIPMAIPAVSTSSTPLSSSSSSQSSMSMAMSVPIFSFPSSTGISAGFLASSNSSHSAVLQSWMNDNDDTRIDMTVFNQLGSLAHITEFVNAIPATVIDTNTKTNHGDAYNHTPSGDKKFSFPLPSLVASSSSAVAAASSTRNDDSSDIEGNVAILSHDATIAAISYNNIINDQHKSLSLLLSSFDSKSRALVASFDRVQRPLAKRHRAYHTSLRALLTGRYVQALVSVIDNHRRHHHHAYGSPSSSSVSRYHDPSNGISYARSTRKAMQVMGRYRHHRYGDHDNDNDHDNDIDKDDDDAAADIANATLSHDNDDDKYDDSNDTHDNNVDDHNNGNDDNNGDNGNIKGMNWSSMEIFINDHKQKLQQSVEREKKAAQREFDDERNNRVTNQRTMMAQSQLAPIFPHLALHQLQRSLELNADNIERAMTWILDNDAALMKMALDHTTDAGQLGLSHISEIPLPATMVRQASAQKYIILRIERIRGDNVILRCALDRYRIPLDATLAKTYVFTIDELLNPSHFRFVNDHEETTICKDMTARIPTIIYQSFGHAEFCPISITPAINFTDYKIDYDSHEKVLRRISHRQDGQILFNAIADDGDFGLWEGSSPIDLYTQVLDGGSHNILHMHLNDVRDDVTIDSAYLTANDDEKKLAAAFEFAKDVAGRMLTYKILVRDRHIEGVLHRKGRAVQRALFKEHVAFDIGSMVSIALPSGSFCVAKVDGISHGLIVNQSSSRDQHFKSDVPRYERGRGCSRKHPMEMEGWIDVMVYGERHDYYDPPRPRSYPLCALSLMNDTQRDELERNRVNWLNNRSRDITDRLAQLEVSINNALRVKPSSISSSPTSPPTTTTTTTTTTTSESSVVPTSASIVADLNSQYKHIDDMLQVSSLEPLRRDHAPRLQRVLRDIRTVALHLRSSTFGGSSHNGHVTTGITIAPSSPSSSLPAMPMPGSVAATSTPSSSSSSSPSMSSRAVPRQSRLLAHGSPSNTPRSSAAPVSSSSPSSSAVKSPVPSSNPKSSSSWSSGADD